MKHRHGKKGNSMAFLTQIPYFVDAGVCKLHFGCSDMRQIQQNDVSQLSEVLIAKTQAHKVLNKLEEGYE